MAPRTCNFFYLLITPDGLVRSTTFQIRKKLLQFMHPYEKFFEMLSLNESLGTTMEPHGVISAFNRAYLSQKRSVGSISSLIEILGSTLELVAV